MAFEMSRPITLPLLIVGLIACGGEPEAGLRQVPSARGLDVPISDDADAGGTNDTEVASDAEATDDAIAPGDASEDLGDASVGETDASLDPLEALCMPCREHADCRLGAAAGGAADAARCLGGIAAGGGRFCLVACGGAGRGCPDGYACADGYCRPSAGECLCSATAVALGASTACAASDGDTVCTGERRCEAVGAPASVCDAAAPSTEQCNGLDDDCDGATDERPLTPSCDGYACRGTEGCATSCADNTDCAPGLACDTDDRDGDRRTDECLATGADGTACDEPGDCDSGYCDNDRCCTNDSPDGGEGPICCAEDADCAALDEPPICASATAAGCVGSQRVGRCQGAVCTAIEVPTFAGCVGQVCEPARCLTNATHQGAHLCDPEGACAPTADATCDDGEACTFDTCDAQSGCERIARSGAIEARCYTHDPATRAIGACREGFLSCVDGVPDACLGEQGPGGERCNGQDDDCDGATDEDGAKECFPYLCSGGQGCRTRCDADAECAAGHFCDDGVCRGTGATGATCADDAECASGHCSGGVCCEAGLCCLVDADCASLDDAICDVAGVDGCAGTRVVGACGEGAMCVSEVLEDASVCSGQVCDGAACAEATLVPEAICDGAACVRGPSEQCSPYACVEGACKTSCAVDGDCSGGAACVDGGCVSLPDGAACTLARECASGHCENGFCCAGPGACCGGDDATCAALDEVAVCDDPGACDGSRQVGVCGDDFRCKAERVDAPEACEGETCGPSRCANLEGGELVLEGRRVQTCSAGGVCLESVRDCRDNEATSYCTRTSTLFSSCQGCTPDRQTCIVFDNPCHCE